MLGTAVVTFIEDRFNITAIEMCNVLEDPRLVLDCFFKFVLCMGQNPGF